MKIFIFTVPILFDSFNTCQAVVILVGPTFLYFFATMTDIEGFPSSHMGKLIFLCLLAQYQSLQQ
jgi:hypothetical protein